MNDQGIGRVIVTGAAGFIGCNLVRKLIEEGHTVLSIDCLTYAGHRKSLSAFDSHPSHEFLKADICDEAAIHKAIYDFAPDWIFHLAAESHVDRSIKDPMKFLHTNVLGTANLLLASTAYWETLKASAKASFRFVHVSTDEVFGHLEGEGQFSESSPYRPRSPYSASKAASDHIVRAWQVTYGLPVVVTCCSNNYGPYQNLEKLIPRVITNLLRGESVPVYGTGLQVRDWIHVADHCGALLLVAQKGEIGSTYLIGRNAESKNIDLVERICDLVEEITSETRSGGGVIDARSLISFVADRPGHDFRYSIDTTKIREELGWSPRWDFEDGLRSTVTWYLENRDWWEETAG